MPTPSFARAAALLLLPALAQAQGIHGSVRDSIYRQPLSGAVLFLLDSAGSTLAREVSTGEGAFHFAALPNARRVRAIRLGFRPREVTLPRDGSGVDVVMPQLPRMLDTVITIDQPGCPRRSDRATAFALWEQAREGLLASVVAREANPARIISYAYERTLARDAVTQLRQGVVRDSAAEARQSFMAKHSAIDFVKEGFRKDTADEHRYMGPDADVLLDKDFVTGYCFSVAPPATDTRPDQIGLRFTTAKKVRGRVDLDGTLWVDTLARAIKDIDFKYVGVEDGAEKLKPGGNVHFQEMPNGVVLIDHWMFRIVGNEVDTLSKMRVIGAQPGNFGGPGSGLKHTFYAIETGGELARADWPDGASWRASLGTVRMRAVDDSGHSLPGVRLRLEETQYEAVTDTAGRADINELVPGPYSIVAVDSTMATLGATILTHLQFVAGRDSTVNALVPVSTAVNYVRRQCAASKVLGPPGGLIVGRATTPDGKPVKDAKFEIYVNGDLVSEHGRTGSDGFLYWCKGLPIGAEAEIRAWRTGEAPRFVRARLDNKLTALAVHMLPEGTKAAEFAGIVASADGEQPISAADVFMPDLNKHAFSDAQGRFRIPEVPPGDHDISVRKVGFAPVATHLTFAAGPAPQRKVLLQRITALDTVSVTATVTQQWMRDFEDNKRLGLGKFWDSAALAKLENSRLSSILSDLSGSEVRRGRGNAAWIARRIGAITMGGTDRSQVTPDDFDIRMGAKPACYADVWVDNSRVYSGRNGEPLFDLNSITPDQIESMEYYTNPSQTPAKFANLNSVCGSLVIWTKN